MRPLTLILAGFLIAGFLVVAGLLFSFSGDSEPAASSLEPTAAASSSSGTRGREGSDSYGEGRVDPRAQERVKEKWAKVLEGRRPVPQFRTAALHEALEKEEKERQRKELSEAARRDGFLFREEGSPKVFIVRNGTKYHVPNPKEFHEMGLSWSDVKVVKPGALDELVSELPQEKVLLRERGDARVYYWEDGKKRWIRDGSALKKMGFTGADVHEVPKGGLKALPSGKVIN